MSGLKKTKIAKEMQRTAKHHDTWRVGNWKIEARVSELMRPEWQYTLYRDLVVYIRWHERNNFAAPYDCGQIAYITTDPGITKDTWRQCRRVLDWIQGWLSDVGDLEIGWGRTIAEDLARHLRVASACGAQLHAADSAIGYRG